MKRSALLLLFLIYAFSIYGQDSNIETLLFDLPDISFKKSKDIANGEEYVLKIKQPIDHSDWSKGYFYQKAYLLHRNMNEETVIVTEGYTASRHKLYEITDLLGANQIQVEHRYFGNSTPEGVDYQYLNLEQATADYHRIKELFGKLYKNNWVSTGISKGGATTIFYRYFYPDDVVVSVPYVAPINDEFEEDRIYQFLDEVGTKECRDKILAVQKTILKQREETLPRIKYFAKGARAKFTYLTFEEAFEFAVLEYPFSFWQWGADCSTIPDQNGDLDKILDHFLSISDITFFADGAMKDYASHYYQSAEEFGYYGYETEELGDLIKAFPEGSRPHAAFTPNKMKVEFKGDLLKKLNKWLEKEAHQFIYIYGENDTWSASAVPKNDKVDAEWFFLKDKSHGDARIKNFSEEESTRLKTALGRWLQIKL